MCLFDELCVLHVSSVTLLAHSVQLQLLLLRMSECGLRSTATTEQSFSHCGLVQEMGQVRLVYGEYSNVAMMP